MNLTIYDQLQSFELNIFKQSFNNRLHKSDWWRLQFERITNWCGNHLFEIPFPEISKNLDQKHMRNIISTKNLHHWGRSGFWEIFESWSSEAILLNLSAQKAAMQFSRTWFVGKVYSLMMHPKTGAEFLLSCADTKIQIEITWKMIFEYFYVMNLSYSLKLWAKNTWNVKIISIGAKTKKMDFSVTKKHNEELIFLPLIQYFRMKALFALSSTLNKHLFLESPYIQTV